MRASPRSAVYRQSETVGLPHLAEALGACVSPGNEGDVDCQRNQTSSSNESCEPVVERWTRAERREVAVLENLAGGRRQWALTGPRQAAADGDPLGAGVQDLGHRQPRPREDVYRFRDGLQTARISAALHSPGA